MQHWSGQNAVTTVQCCSAKQAPAGLCKCNYTCGDLFSIQVCSEPTEMQCGTVLGKMKSPLFSAALQNKLTAGFCQCNYTYGDLLFIQVCSEPTEMQCSTGLGKMQSPLFSAALQNRLQQACVNAITPVEICSPYRCAVSQQKCSAVLFWAK